MYDKYVSGTWQSPYQVETVFAISPASDSYVGKNQQLLLPAPLWLSNDGTAISNIQVDAGDGLGYRTITYGQLLTVNYPDTGRKVLNYKLNLNNNTSLYSHSQIHIKASVIESIPGIQTIPITATEAFKGQYAQGTMTIRYANSDLKLRNPLIVAEGFDAGKILSPEAEFGDTDLGSFLGKINRSPDLFNLLNDGSRQFDIVYVDWGDGTDDIKKNALLLKQVIREVNSRKAQAGSSSKNVVLGQSMGGLVTRWALKDMENNSENHQTKLYISDDSPHLGANVPLGYLYLAKHLRNLYIKTGTTAALAETYQFITGGASPFKMLSLSDRPASRQMLINYVNGNYQIDNTLHNQWQSELKAMGYPQGVPGNSFKKVAISNGAQCATGQQITPGGSLLSYYGKANTRFLGDIAGMIAAPILSDLLGQAPLLLGVIPGRNDINFELYINSTNTGGGNQVYFNKISYKKTVLWLIPVTVNITDKNFSAPSGMLPYDSFSGGFYDVGFDLNSSSSQNWFYKYNVTASNTRQFNFVPTASALDIGSGNVALIQTDYQTKYLATSPPVAPKNTPFQNFTSGRANVGVNEDHISFNAANGSWLADELQSINAPTVDCTFLCADNQISGPSSFCATASYILNNLPIGATVIWNVTGNLTISGSNTANPVIVNGSSGSGTLSANVIGVCGNVGLTKQITMSSAPAYSTLSGTYTTEGFSTSIEGQSQLCLKTYMFPGFYSGVISLNDQVATSYTWTLVSTSHPTNNPVTTGIGLVPGSASDYNITVKPQNGRAVYRLTTSNNCGSFTRDYTFVADGICFVAEMVAPPANENLSISPNPVTGLFTVSLKDVNKANPIKEISLHNRNGKEFKRVKFGDGKSQQSLNIQNLPPDIYIIRVFDGEKWFSDKIIKE